MPTAGQFDSTPNSENLSRILRRALRLAELAGEERDAVRREMLITECMACWRAAQRLAHSGREGVMIRKLRVNPHHRGSRLAEEDASNLGT